MDAATRRKTSSANMKRNQSLSPVTSAGDKVKVSRNHGACDPCKLAKTRCDGGAPCSACLREKRKSRVCYYSKKAQKIRESKRQQEEMSNAERECSSPDEDDDSPPAEVVVQYTRGEDCGGIDAHAPSIPNRIAFQRVVDEFFSVKGYNSRGIILKPLERLRSLWSKFTEVTAPPTTVGNIITIDPSLSDGNTSRRPSTDTNVVLLDHWRSKLDWINAKMGAGHLREAYQGSGALLRTLNDTLHAFDDSEEDFVFEKDKIVTEAIELECSLAFFVGGYSCSIPRWSIPSFEYTRPAGEEGDYTDKLALFEQISMLLDMDTSVETTIFEFAHMMQDIKAGDQPRSAITKMAFCINDERSIEQQRCRALANMIYMAMYCRDASISNHYAHSDKVVLTTSGNKSDIINTGNYQKARTRTDKCKFAIKHAGIILDVFATLCEDDTDQTAKDWILLHGALSAVVVVGIHAIRAKCWEGKEVDEAKQGKLPDISSKERIITSRKCFQRLRERNPSCPIFRHAEDIFKEIFRAKSEPKKHRRRKMDAIMDEESEEISDEDVVYDRGSSITPNKPAHLQGTQGGNKRNIDQVIYAGNNSRPMKSRRLASPPQSQVVTFPSTTVMPMAEVKHDPEHAVNIAKSFGKAVPFDLSPKQPMTPLQPEYHPISMIPVYTPDGMQYYDQNNRFWTDATAWGRPLHPPQEYSSSEEIICGQDNRSWAIHRPEASTVLSPCMSGFTYNIQQVPEHQMTSPNHPQINSTFMQNQPSPCHAVTEDAEFMAPISKPLNELHMLNIAVSDTMTRPSLQARRHSDMSLHPHQMVAPMNNHVWSSMDAIQSSPLHETSNINSNLPPRPESVIPYQSDQTTPVAPMYPFQEQFCDQPGYTYMHVPSYQFQGYQMPQTLSQPASYSLVRG